jgi:hypothetical protein
MQQFVRQRFLRRWFVLWQQLLRRLFLWWRRGRMRGRLLIREPDPSPRGRGRTRRVPPRFPHAGAHLADAVNSWRGQRD